MNRSKDSNKNQIEIGVNSPNKSDISVRSGEADITHVSDRHFGLADG